MPKIIELTNPHALMVPSVQELIKRAVSSVDFAAPGGPDTVAQDMFEFVKNPVFFVLMGFENGEPHALAFGHYPTTYLFPYPVITLIYNEGSKELKKELCAEMFNLLAHRGFGAAWAINGTGHSDEAWTRALIPDYVNTRRLGSLMELSIK